ncbi:hypothetical protein PUMCH_002264 [Australozyma saopauloensis]|uniref:WD repeat-containing protein JIP5 n=1 Tax=Australozyma saopauloensis TaxID=291208 RepID=A0AAX4H8T8_9ASCO|nr:hypothetical protein PUMCH_002264 [[Candida] saopauloensis]
MARKKGSKTSGLEDSESAITPILEISQSEPLFTAAAHPSKPIIATGLGTGHVFCYSYDDEELQEIVDNKRAAFLKKNDSDDVRVSLLKKKWWVNEKDHSNMGSDSPVTINWKTKRHKGSCRSVTFDVLENSVGEHLYSVGTDHMIKKAMTETGKVVAKTDFSSHLGEEKADEVTTVAASTTHPFLLAGTEDGNVLVFDSNKLSSPELKFRCDKMHEDAVSKILPMPAISAYHYLSLGSTVLSHIDIRKGIITQSDDQSDELLSMCYPTEYMYEKKNDTVIVGHGEGIVTLWKNSTNCFMDQLSRVKVNKNASIDTLIAPMNAGDPNLLDSIWCGDSDGLIHRINYKRGKVVERRAHSYLSSKMGLTDEVSGLDIDYQYRLISSGMESLKIWSAQTEEDLKNESNSEDDSDSDSDSDSDLDSDMSDSDDGKFGGVPGSGSDDDAFAGKKSSKKMDSEDESDQEGEEDNESDDDDTNGETTKKVAYSTSFSKPKRKMINLNKKSVDGAEGEKSSENKKRKLKQVAKSIPNNGIARFDGL